MIDLRRAEWDKDSEPCVNILESVSSEDLLYNCLEGRALKSALQQAHIRCRYYLVNNKTNLQKALHLITKQRLLSNERIALHISCHGNEKGITLTSKESILWGELRNMLIEFAKDANAYHNTAKISTIILCMSSCFGLNAKAMAKNEGSPFLSLIAPTQKVSWSDSLASFLVFYNLFLNKGKQLSDIIGPMNLAAGIKDLFQILDLSNDLK